MLKNKRTSEINAPVNYACIFSHNEKEFIKLNDAAKNIGRVIRKTQTGPLFRISPIVTVSGKLELLKIRLPDKTRPEQGDADFTIDNYAKFKSKHITKTGFRLIEREGYEMIELTDSQFDVRAYFSNPPLDRQLGL